MKEAIRFFVELFIMILLDVFIIAMFHLYLGVEDIPTIVCIFIGLFSCLLVKVVGKCISKNRKGTTK